MPSTVTTNELLVASTAKLLAKLTVGVVPKVTAGVESIPRTAKFDLVTAESEKPNKAMPAALVPVTATLDSSPVLPDDNLKILFTESYVIFMP